MGGWNECYLDCVYGVGACGQCEIQGCSWPDAGQGHTSRAQGELTILPRSSVRLSVIPV